MAAHLRTGIKQVLDDIENGRPEEVLKRELTGATDLVCWTEDDTAVWTVLYEYVLGKIDLQELEQALRHYAVQAEAEWERLGRPETREEWHKAKYIERQKEKAI